MPATKKSTSTKRKPAVKRVVRPAKKIDVPEIDPVPWQTAVEAAEAKKAEVIRVLDLRPVTSFADTMILCTGSNARQIQAIADEVETQLKQIGERPKSVEGYSNAEWVLMDYGDYIVNIFSTHARSYYDLDRLWHDAPVLSPAAPAKSPVKVTS